VSTIKGELTSPIASSKISCVELLIARGCGLMLAALQVERQVAVFHGYPAALILFNLRESPKPDDPVYEYACLIP
jgi:hypothetical protein